MNLSTHDQATQRRRPAQRLTVLYDADCAFCTATTRWLERRDHAGRLTFVPLQAAIHSRRPRLREVAKAHDLAAALHVVDEASGRVVAGGGAMLEVLAVLPRWRTVARLAGVGPGRGATELAYRAIANHRAGVGRLLGITGVSCQTPHGEDGAAG